LNKYKIFLRIKVIQWTFYLVNVFGCYIGKNFSACAALVVLHIILPAITLAKSFSPSQSILSQALQIFSVISWSGAVCIKADLM
jgi:hypothetical protein